MDRKRGKARGNGDGKEQPPVDEQGVSDADQTRSASDQTTADADQSASDTDQILADRDQAQSLADQEASDRDQATSDRELAANPADLEHLHSHERGRVARKAGTVARDASALGRTNTARERTENAERRDRTARERDRAAEERDRAAAARDEAGARWAQSGPASRGGAGFQAALKNAEEVRARAAADRARAAADRDQAARDREQAAIDRHHALVELRRAHVDELTGAYRRGIGEVALQQEVDRARRSNSSMVLAYVDVDGLKEVNDRLGHAGGDALLRDVASALRSKMRSYEPLVRFGGDEFVCAFGGIDIERARRRFAEIRADWAEDGNDRSVSVGLAGLRPDDELSDLIDRADTALIAARRHD